MSSCLKTIAIALIAFSVTAPLKADTLDNLADSLIQLRDRVEGLRDDLDTLKADQKNRIGSLSLQRRELESNIEREELKIKQLQKSLDKNRKLAQESGVDNTRLKPAVLAAIDELEQHIRGGLPFKIDERLAGVADLRARVQAESMPANKAVNRLWALYEDEIRLANESGLYRQTIKVGGAERLADVARLGTVMMFFKTEDDGFGRAVKSTDGWRFEYLHDGDDRDRVAALFTALQKQIRNGYFELPNALNVEAN